MQSFSKIIDAIKELKSIEKDAQVAELLGIKPKSMAGAKSRNSIPYQEIIVFCSNHDISLDKVFNSDRREEKELSGLKAAELILNINQLDPDGRMSIENYLDDLLLESTGKKYISLTGKREREEKNNTA